MYLLANIAIFLIITVMCVLIVTGAVTIAVAVTDLVESRLVRRVIHE